MAIITNYVRTYPCAFMCNKCGHIWVPNTGAHRTADNPPRHCGNKKCKSRNWNKTPVVRIPRPRPKIRYSHRGSNEAVHCGPIYTLPDITERDPVIRPVEKEEEEEEEEKFVPDPNVKYIMKCNVCLYVWQCKHPGIIPTVCTNCHTRLNGTTSRGNPKRKLKDWHEIADYSIHRHCASCKKNYPRESGILTCEYCLQRLRNGPRVTYRKKDLKYIE